MSTSTTSRTATARTATAAPKVSTAKADTASAGRTPNSSLQQHLNVVTEPDVLHVEGLYAFCESLRALTSGLAFMVHTASAQLDVAARKGARDSADGRLTLVQKTQLQVILRKMSRQLQGQAADSLLDAARASVKAYSLMEGFLEELESDTVSRPHRSARGGFTFEKRG